ncbi:MAG: N-6 DNA methylase [Pseudonocardiaceae bacterium]
MSDRELVTMTEIAEFAEVRRPTVSNWRRRHADFPSPERRDGTQPAFDAGQVAAWLAERPLPNSPDARTYGDLFRTNLELRVLARTGTGREALHVSLTLVALRIASGQVLPGDPERIAGLAEQTEAAHPELAGVFTTDLSEVSEEYGRLAQTVERLLASTGPAQLAERLMASVDDVDSVLRVGETPRELANLVAELTGDVNGLRVCVLAAGTGGLLLRVVEGQRPEAVVAGEEDPHALRVLRHRLICHGIDALTSQGDSLVIGVTPEADVVLVDPPFTSGEFQTTRGAARRGPWDWARQAVQHLAPGGRAYVVVPAWALDREGAVLEAALAERMLTTVVQLPRRIHRFRTGAEFALLGLVSAGEGSDEVVLCNADRLIDGGSWPQQVARLIRAEGTAAPDVCRRVPVAELRERRSLVPAHLLAPVRDSLGHFAEVTAARRAAPWAEAWLARLAFLEPAGKPDHLLVRDLLRTGQLRLLPGHRIAPEDIGATGYRVIGEDELSGRRPLGSRGIDALVHAGYPDDRTERGDVIVLAERGMHTMVDEDGGSVVLYPAQVLRLTRYRELSRAGEPLWMRPRVLARLLTAPRNVARESGSLVRRVDLRSLELPILTPDEVTRLEEILADLDRQRADLTQRLAALNRLDTAILAGIADGAVRVGARNARPGGDDERSEHYGHEE